MKDPVSVDRFKDPVARVIRYSDTGTEKFWEKKLIKAQVGGRVDSVEKSSGSGEMK